VHRLRTAKWVGAFFIAAVASTSSPGHNVVQEDLGPHDCPSKFAGRPRDIDYIANLKSVQVILSSGPRAELISHSDDPRLLSIAETAFTLKASVAVDYELDPPHPSPKLVCIQLALGPPANPGLNPPPKPGEILSLAYHASNKSCFAVIRAHDPRNTVAVYTQDSIAQGILETAVRTRVPVQELEFDAATKRIKRVKVNMP
jgi:hypothetical protein